LPLTLPKFLVAYAEKMELSTARLLLRELSLADLEAIHHLHSLPEVDEFNTLGIPDSLATTKHLVADWLTQLHTTPRTSYVLVAQRASSQEFVGLIALNLGKANFRNAEVWYKFLPAHWGQGLTTEALTALLTFGFDHLHLHRIEAGCAIENIASMRVLEKVGMTREGRKRQVLPIRGAWVDNYFFAILATDRATG
jgi:ribosomal-protein-alanine N-acetyltransferase